MRSAAAMAEAANKFLASLTPEQKAKASLDFADENRRDWTIVPRDRKGVPLKDLDENQRRLAMDFMKTGLGASGYQKATTIMSLEPVLAQLEGPNRRFPRDPELYYFSIFGTPSPKTPWGWRVEGHHISIHFTIVKGEMLSNTPLAFGSNPAEVREGERKGLRALAGEEDRGRDLILALDEKQRAVAIFDQKAPSDILTLAKIKADPLKPEGIPAGQMNKQQKALLEKLIDEYLARMPQDVAAERSKKMRNAGFDKIHFAWAGGVNKGDPHYYRVQSPTFLIEYDNTQNNANHIHSVWRDFNGDFGEDLLREHYQTTPHGTPQQNSPQQKSELRPAQQPPQEATQVLNPNAPAVANPEDLTIKDSVTITDKDPGLKPTILYREKAKYTVEARDAGIQGIIVLMVVFGVDGKLRDINVVRGLPFGLTQKAIDAAKKIRFRPAYKDGRPVNVRGSVEFTFQVFDDVASMPSGILQAGVGGVTKPELTEVKKPEYTEAARNNKIEGKVRLFVVFRSNGKIGEVEVIEGLPDGLTEKAIEVAKALKFKPATYSNKPVNVWSEIAITFKLDQS
jgi:TonB family protein